MDVGEHEEKMLEVTRPGQPSKGIDGMSHNIHCIMDLVLRMYMHMCIPLQAVGLLYE